MQMQNSTTAAAVNTNVAQNANAPNVANSPTAPATNINSTYVAPKVGVLPTPQKGESALKKDLLQINGRNVSSGAPAMKDYKSSKTAQLMGVLSVATISICSLFCLKDLKVLKGLSKIFKKGK